MTTQTTATPTGTGAGPRPADPTSVSRSNEASFWVASTAFLVAMAFSTVPTPLYVLYARKDRLSSLTITIVFAVYAVGVIASLVTAGHVSDWLGRKRVFLAAIGVEAVAGVLFLSSTSLPELLVARFVTGLGVGAITATATAFLSELHTRSRPNASRQRFDVVSGLANLGGLGVGPLVAGALAQWAPAPLRTPYLVFLALLLLSALLLAVVAPETVELHRANRPTYRPQRPRVTGSPLGWGLAAGSAVTAFSVFGLFTSLAPTFVGNTLGHPSRLLAGTMAFLAFGTAPLAQLATSRLRAPVQLVLGVAGELTGLALLAVGMEDKNLGCFIASALVLGCGAGVLFRTAVGRTIAVSAGEHRGEALAGLFLVAYAGLVVPAVGVGVATVYVSPTTAMLYFAVIVGVLLLSIGALAPAARRADATAAASPPTT